MCLIGVMTGYRLYGIRFQQRCVSDWCDDWLQAVNYTVRTAVWVSDWCDDRLHVVQYKVLTAVCVTDWCYILLQSAQYTV